MKLIVRREPHRHVRKSAKRVEQPFCRNGNALAALCSVAFELNVDALDDGNFEVGGAEAESGVVELLEEVAAADIHSLIG